MLIFNSSGKDININCLYICLIARPFDMHVVNKKSTRTKITGRNRRAIGYPSVYAVYVTGVDEAIWYGNSCE
jgi:hypothetical protein